MATMKVGTRLMLGFGAVALAMIVVGAVGIFSIRVLDEKATLIAEDRMPKTIWANKIITQINLQGRALRNAMIYKDAEAIKKELSRIPEARREVAENYKKLEDTIKSPRGRELMTELAKRREAFLVTNDQVRKELEAGAREGASANMLAMLREVQGPYLEAIDKLIDYQTELAVADAKAAEETAHSAQKFMIVMLLLGTMIAGVTGFLITRKLLAQLGGEPEDAAAVAKSIAAGDFTHQVRVRPGDTASMMASMQSMQAGLRGTIQELRGSVDQVDLSAAGMATAAHQSAQGSADAADAASSMAAAVEQVTVSINHVADSAKEALTIANQAGTLSEEGGSVIESAVAEMKRIAGSVRAVADSIGNLEEQSDRISGIVQTIKDVADQTNLLALNAAIEAARAGEAGRGFAVVADEVRKLAERTTQATGEIGGMIGGIQGSAQAAVTTMREAVGQVDHGTELAEKAGAAISSIRSATGEVATVMNDISAAISEQGVASTAIAQQVERVAQSSEENSASARQSSQSAEELRHLAKGMHGLIERFRV